MAEQADGGAQDVPLDSVHVDVLIRAQKKAGEKSTTTVRIFEKNDFYYFFEKDAEFAAQFTYGSSMVTKTMGKTSPITYCSINHANFESLLRHILLVKHYRVEVFKFVAPRAGNAARYDLEVRASPGNISSVEHILYGEGEDRRETNFLVAIKLGPSSTSQQIVMGIAAVETSLNSAHVTEVEDNDLLQQLESILVSVGPREVLLPQSDSVLVKKLKEVVERNRILATHRPTKDFSQLADTEITRLLAPKASPEPVRNSPLASGALRAVSEYLSLGDGAGLHVEPLSRGEAMRIDPRALQGLNLMPNPSNPSHPSLFSILNKTRTPGGSRLMHSWLKQPLLSVEKIVERLDLVEVMVTNTEIRQACYEEHLRKFPDFQRLAAKFAAKRANLQDAFRVFVAFEKLSPAVESLQSYAGDAQPALQDNFIKDLQESQRDLENFYRMVETTIDLEEVKRGNFLIKPSFDENLQELREMLDDIEGKLQECKNRAASDLGIASLKLEESPVVGGFYFRVTLKEGGGLPKNKNYTIIDQPKTGIRFRNAQLSRLNDEHQDVKRRYEDQQKSVVAEVMDVASGYADPLLHLGRCISRLDCIVAMAVAAVTAPTQYVRPKILPSTSPRELTFSQLRHPIVELQDNVNYIPNDVTLSKSSSLHLITGPNMGGKSTYLRSVGCAVLMAQCGSFVPADSATLSVVDSVLVRIGASDCQVEGRSTFMAEMVETSAILTSATSSSLILIDELGRGTSTYDGFGLAWAVSEHIATKVNSFTLFTTHYTELTQLADKVDCVTNYHVSALTDSDRLTLLYQLQPGVCDGSFGINVAQMVKFPKEVIAEAEGRLARLNGGGREGEKGGEELLSSFLEKVAVLEGKGQDGKENFREIVKEAEACQNPFIKELVAQAKQLAV